VKWKTEKKTEEQKKDEESVKWKTEKKIEEQKTDEESVKWKTEKKERKRWLVKVDTSKGHESKQCFDTHLHNTFQSRHRTLRDLVLLVL
jgi:hypothetical protein